MSKAGTGLSITSKCSQVKTRFVGEVHAVAWRLRRGPARPPLFLYKISIGDSELRSMSALAHFVVSSRTSCEVREWDGPAALPPPTGLRVRRGLVRKGSPPCPARPLFTQ